jgi:Oxysterol-binding protein
MREHFMALMNSFQELASQQKQTSVMVRDMTVQVRRVVEQVAEREIERDAGEFMRRESFLEMGGGN